MNLDEKTETPVAITVGSTSRNSTIKTWTKINNMDYNKFGLKYVVILPDQLFSQWSVCLGKISELGRLSELSVPKLTLLYTVELLLYYHSYFTPTSCPIILLPFMFNLKGFSSFTDNSG